MHARANMFQPGRALRRTGLACALVTAGCLATPRNAPGTTDPGIAPPGAQEVGQSATQSVGTSGGTVGTPAQSAFAAVPPGALVTHMNLSVQVNGPQGMPLEANLLTNVYDFGPRDTAFLKSVILTLAIATPPTASQQAMVAYLDANQTWQALLDSSYNPSTGAVTATTTHFAPFTIVAYGTNGAGCAKQRDPDAFCDKWQLLCDLRNDVCGSLSFTVGGSVTGLSGSVTLRNDLNDAVVLTTDGTFTFPSGYPSGDSYVVTVAQASRNQNCAIQNFSGTIFAADVTDIVVVCRPPTPTTYPLGGCVSGLDPADSLTLVQGDQTVVVTTDGDFIFPAELAPQTQYMVSVSQAPTGKACEIIENASGTVSGVTLDIQVRCHSAGSLSFATGQNARVVVGEPDFVSNNAAGAVAANLVHAPWGSAYLAGNGALYVGDAGSYRALIYKQLPAVNGAAADGALGQQNLVQSMSLTPEAAIASSGHFASISGEGNTLLAADPFDNRVLVYLQHLPTADSNASWVVGQTGLSHRGNTAACSRNGLNAPFGVAVAHNRAIIADTSNHRVLIYRSVPKASGAPADVVLGQPDFTTCVQPGPVSDVTLDAPQGVWTDGNRLLVADTGANRVLVWQTFPTVAQQPADAVIGQKSFTTRDVVAGSMGTSQPTGVASDGHAIWTSSQGFHRVEQWPYPTAAAPSPSAVAVLGQANFDDITRNACDCSTPNPRGLYLPGGVSVAGTSLVVTDTGNNRYLIFASE